MIERIQKLPTWQRWSVFIGAIVFVLFIMGSITALVLYNSAVNTPRTEAVIISEGDWSVREFATLPDEDSYPATLALDADGVLYTASYASGTVWQISTEGDVIELPNTRNTIGSVSALAFHPNGDLYILDRVEPLVARGAVIWRQDSSGNLSEWVILSDDEMNGVVLPDDIEFDANGNLYLTDRGTDRIWRFDANANGEIWWQSPIVDGAPFYAPTGLAYNALTQEMLITDSALNIIYSVNVNSPNPNADTETLYRHNRTDEFPGFDGLSIGDDGLVYIGALGTNRVAQFNLETQELRFIAGAFRGSSDVAYSEERRRVYVVNWDQRSFLPVDILFFQINIDPHLPFAIDVIEKGES